MIGSEEHTKVAGEEGQREKYDCCDSKAAHNLISLIRHNLFETHEISARLATKYTYIERIINQVFSDRRKHVKRAHNIPRSGDNVR